jgi:DUF4097 and DUF4098 domain-containing protein YvlB
MPTFDTPAPAAVRVDVPAGAVTVQTWSEPRVDVEVTAKRNDDASRAAAEETRIEASERGGRHEIAVRAPKREGGRFGISWGRGAELDVVVRCPEGTHVDLTTHSADLDARGTLGEVGVRSASGDASVLEAQSLSFATASGDLTAGFVAGPLTVKSASGDIDVKDVAGAATASTVSGDLRIGHAGGTAAVSTVSGDIDVELADAGVRANAVSGDVVVAMRPGLGLWIDVQSVSGDVSSELDVGDAPAGEGEPVELRVRTVSGDVRVSRARAAASA